MKALTFTALLASLALASLAAQAASFTFVKKEPEKAGAMTYTYSYSCANRATGMFSLVARNDEEARKLAEPKAKRVCEE